MIDKRAILQVVGCLVKKPSLLLDYDFSHEDFSERFHRVVFAAISNLYNEGVSVNPITIDTFLAKYESQYEVFINNNGLEYLDKASQFATVEDFRYFYTRVKKYSLLRKCVEKGIDISDIYSEEIVDPVKQTEMQKQFDSYELKDILDIIDKKVIDIKDLFINPHGATGRHAGEGAKELKKEMEETPEIGMPLQGKILNNITRGARLKKLYLRSAPTGLGKTRLSVGDATLLSTNKFFSYQKGWIPNGVAAPTLFITSELEVEEIQTLTWAFVSGVNEQNILDGDLSPEQNERVNEAINTMKESQLWIEHLPNYSVTDVIQTIKKYHILHGVKYVFFDYIHTTMKMLSEVSKDMKVQRLREDVVLGMFSSAIKDLCNELGIFVYSGTQLSSDWETKKNPNQNLLRGAKSLGDYCNSRL